MNGRNSAFAVLGLSPDADGVQIEQAYRRMMKLHHPDRPGGNAARAAEINQAYRELRRARPFEDPLDFNEELPGLPPRPRGRPFFVLAATALLAAVILVSGVGHLAGEMMPGLRSSLPKVKIGGASRSIDPIEGPLHEGDIDQAVREAAWMIREQDEMALASRSQACHDRFRTRPDTMQLDRCAAFDDAVVHLQDRDPYKDRGPFSALAVTRRQWAAASQISENYLAVDTRLKRIGLRVELALAPPPPNPSEPLKTGGD